MLNFFGLFFELLFDLLSFTDNLLFQFIVYILLSGFIFEFFWGLVYYRD